MNPLPPFDPHDLELAQLTIGQEVRHNPAFIPTRAFLLRRLRWGFGRAERILAEIRRLNAVAVLPPSSPAPASPATAGGLSGAARGVPRYLIDHDGVISAAPSCGDWVLYSAHNAALSRAEARTERLRVALEGLMNTLDEEVGTIGALTPNCGTAWKQAKQALAGGAQEAE